MQAVTVLTAGRHTGPEFSDFDVAGHRGFTPCTVTGVAPCHVQRRINARVANNDFATTRCMHDGWPSDANGLYTFVSDLAPRCTIVEVVTRTAVAERRQLEAHGPSCRNCIRSTSHAVIDGSVRLKIVLGVADDLALYDKVTVLDVLDVRVRLTLQRLLRTVREVGNRMGLHRCGHTQRWRELGHIFQQGLTSGLEGLCKSSESYSPHHQEN